MFEYRKKPVVIEARQTGQDYDIDCEIVGWCNGRAVGPDVQGHDLGPGDDPRGLVD